MLFLINLIRSSGKAKAIIAFPSIPFSDSDEDGLNNDEKEQLSKAK